MNKRWMFCCLMPLLVIALVSGCGDDSGSGCPPGQSKCGNECVDVSKDRLHCGSCNNGCAAGQFCFGGSCMPCSDECTDGEKRCAPGSTNMYQVCGDPDNDTCKEWMAAQTCGTGQVCEAGDCVADCTDECSLGQRECSGNGWRQCGDWDTDDCLEWSTVTDCQAGQICDPATGQCVVACTEECNQAGDRRCIPDPLEEGYEICGDYDADDCLEWGQRTICPPPLTCDTQTVTCSSSCQDDCAENQRICDGNGYRVCGYYDADPCLDWSGITNCASYETCNAQTGQCEISCSDECPSQGDKRCSTDDGYDTCGDFDTDPCLEWGGYVPCGGGFKCDGGACVEDCQDDCTAGERVCDVGGYHVCGDYDTDSCLDWSDIYPCAAGEVCDGGVCSRECQNECSTAGEKECSGSGWRECGENDTDDCLDWLAVTDCLAGQICDPATVECVDACSDECTTSGGRECYANGWRECGNYDSDSCLDWSSVNPCGSGQVCNPDTVQCIDDCFDECYVMNDRQCSGDGYDICGDYDSDSCKEWGAHVVCPVNQTCSDGQCQAVCNDECTQAGEVVCDGTGWRMCGEYDMDDCLDWSGITYCAYNERCNNGVCEVLCEDQCTAIGERGCYQGGERVCEKPAGSPCLDWSDVTLCQVDEMCYRGRCISSTPPTVLVNEILYDDEGNDGEFEYIELYGPGTTSLDNFAVVGINGANGQEYMRIELDGYSLPTDGHFVIATSIADAQLAAERDMTHGSGNLLQNDHDNLRVVYAEIIVTDALGYGDFSDGGTFIGEGTAAEEANYDNPNTYCLSRGASHYDSDDNLNDFWKRTICTPGWEGPGAEVWPAVFVYGGSSTPAVDSLGNIYTVDEDGWPTMTTSAGVREYNEIPDQDLTSSFAVSPDQLSLYAGSVSGLYALTASTGLTDTSWPLTVPAEGFEVHSSPAIGSDGTIYFGTRGDGFYAVNPDGTVKWQYPTANWVDSSPAMGFIGSLGEEYVVFGVGGTASGEIVAIDADVDPQNVVPVWTQSAGGGCNSSPAIGVDGNVYIGCDDGLLFGLEGSTGNPIADFPVSVASGTTVDTTLVEGCSPTTVPEATSGDIIYMTSHSTGTDVGNLYIYLTDGGGLAQGWILPGTNSSVTVGDDGSYLVHSGEFLFCFSLAGLMEWGVQIPVSSAGSIVSSPVIGPNGVIYLLETWIGADGGYLWAIQGHANLFTGAGSFPKFRGDLGNWGWGY